MKRIIFLIIIAANFVACGTTSVSQILSSECFWDYFDKRYTKDAVGCYRFYSNGVCKQFTYKIGPGLKKYPEVYKYYDDDLVLPDVWRVNGDSLFIRGTYYKVIKFSQDTIMVRFFNLQDTIYLSKNCATKLEME